MLEEVSAIGFGGIVGLKDRVGVEVIPGGGLSRTRVCRLEGRSHTEQGSDWRRVDGVVKSVQSWLRWKREITEMPRDGLGIGDEGTSASASPGLGGPPSPLHHVPADESWRNFLASSVHCQPCPARAG